MTESGRVSSTPGGRDVRARAHALRLRLFLTTSAVWLLAILVATLGVAYVLQRTEADAWRGRQSEAARNAAQAVAAYHQSIQDTLDLAGLVGPDKLTAIPSLFETLLEANTALLELALVDASGQVLAGAHTGQAVLTSLFTLRQSQWFRQALKGEVYDSDIQFAHDGAPYLILSQPAAGGAVVVTRARMGILWKVVEDIRFGARGRVYVVNRSGCILAHTQPEMAETMNCLDGWPELQAALSASRGEWSGDYVNVEGELVVGSFAPVAGTDWLVAAELSQDEAFGASRRLLPALAAGMLLLAVAVEGVIAAFGQRLIFRPLDRLREGAERVGRGDLGHRIDLRVRDEIGAVADAFDEMAGRLQEQRRALEQARDELETRVAARTAELNIANAQLRRDALRDALTGLPNRALFLERLDRALERARSRHGSLAAVLFVDLDQFKLINDSLGHLAGDRLLVAAAAQLAASIRPGDTVARLGGDEFAILLEGIQSASDATEVAGRLQSKLMVIDLGEGFERTTTASIGIALVLADYERAADILRDADTAMYRAKSLGRARCQVFDTEMHRRAVAQLRLESDLRRALERGEIVAHYQPVVSGADGHIVGLEALARWHHPERGLVMPDQFIGAAEESGLIASIDEQVLRQACAQARVWRASGWPDVWVSVNVSSRQFNERNLPRLLRQALDESGLPGSAVRIEVTESVAMSSLDVTAGTLRELEDIGVEAALDDFGIGYSSMGYLTRFPLRAVKIDRSFVRATPGDAESATIVGAIVAMAHSLHLNVVAEGVETAEQLAALQAHGVDAMQGYLFSQALPADQVTAHLSRSRRSPA